MVVALALGSALAYGIADFLGGWYSRKASPWVISMYSSLGGVVAMVALSVLVRGEPTTTHFIWGLVAGIGGGAGTVFLYRGMALGQIGTVAPLSAVGSAVVPLLVGVGGGERPTLLGWCGILLAIPAVAMIAREHANDGVPRTAEGVIDGLLAGAGFGLSFTALGHVPDSAGYAPLVGTQLVALMTAVLVAQYIFGASPWSGRLADARGMIAGVLAAGAMAMFVLASSRGLLSVTAVLASLYPAFTVILAVAVLRERIARIQAVGLALGLAAVALIAAG